MKFLRWLSKPCLTYLDCVVIASATALYPVIGWWHLVVMLIGIILSTAVEMAARS